MRTKAIPAWTTGDEMRFLDGIGTYESMERDRELLLHKYERAMLLRQNWGHIDKPAVLLHVAKLRGRAFN